MKKPVKVEKKISETFFYEYEDLCSFPYVTPDSEIPFGMLTLMYPLSSIVYEFRVWIDFYNKHSKAMFKPHPNYTILEIQIEIIIWHSG